MSSIRKMILIAVAVLSLLSVVGIVFAIQQPPDQGSQLLFSCQIRSNELELETFYSDADSTHYLFLPSCADLNQIRFKTDNVQLTLCGKSCRNGDRISRLALEKVYPIVIDSRSASVSTRLCVVQSDIIPMMDVRINENYLKRIYQDQTYKGHATMSLYSCDGLTLYEGSSTPVLLKGRGNSTWWEDKKPFLLILDKPDTLLGMARGQKWVLLANSMDPSHLRNKIVLDYAVTSNLLWNPDSRYVDLYINGLYNGLYHKTEKIELSDTRLNPQLFPQYLLLNDIEGTITKSGSPSYPLFGDQRVGLVDCYPGEPVSIDALVPDLNRLKTFLNGGNISDSLLSDIIDIPSWACKYVVDEMFLNGDVWRRSNFFYCFGTPPFKFYGGPVWDYDRAMTSFDEEIFSASEKMPPLHTLWRHPAFRQFADSLYEESARPYILRLINGGIDSLACSVAPSVHADSVRWNPQVSTDSDQSNAPNPVASIKQFFIKRLPLLDKLLLGTDSMQYITYESPSPGLRGFYTTLLYHRGIKLSDYFSVPPSDTTLWIDSATGRFYTIDSIPYPGCCLDIVTPAEDQATPVVSRTAIMFKWLLPIVFIALFAFLFLLMGVREVRQSRNTYPPQS